MPTASVKIRAASANLPPASPLSPGMARAATSEDRARHLARLLVSLRPLDHVPVVLGQQLVTIERPSHREAGRDLAAALLRPELPAFATLLQRTPTPVTNECMTLWAKHLAELALARDLPRLARSGARPLRKWKHADMEAERVRLGRRLVDLRALARKASRLADPEAADTALRTAALGPWRPDASRGRDGIATVLAAQFSAAGLTLPLEFEAVPDDALVRLVQAVERINLLFGPKAGHRVLRTLARPYANVRPTDAMRAFMSAAAVQEHATTPFAPESDEAAMAQQLRKGLARKECDPAKHLAKVFCHRFHSAADAAERDRLRRAAEDRLDHGLGAAAAGLVQAWCAERIRELSQPELQVAQVHFLLATPGWGGDVPEACNGSLHRWARQLSRLSIDDQEKTNRLGQRFGLDSWYEHILIADALRAKVPGNLLGRLLRRHRLDLIPRFGQNVARLTRYLDCRDALQQRPIPGLNPEQPWLLELYRSGKPWAAMAAVTVLHQVRKSMATVDLAALHAISRAMAHHGPLAEYQRALADALEGWATPVVGARPTEAERLVAAGVKPDAIDRYLHLRRLAGYGETVARGLVEFRTEAEVAREITSLQKRLAEACPATACRIAQRLVNLADPDRQDRLREAARARTRARFERSVAVLERESLARLTDSVCRGYLERTLGRTLEPGPLPNGLWEALALLAAPSISHPLLTSFLNDVIAKRPMRQRPANAAWLKAAARNGLVTRTWLGGFHATLTVAGEPIAFATESDPLHVLQMGTYFQTCLSLGSGFNAASTLMNAVDVNKQVIFGRKADGQVVARKLIGATTQGELAGYQLYTLGMDEAIEQALVPELLAYAGRCGLRASDTATPEVLHQGFWYDDGNVTWALPKTP